MKEKQTINKNLILLKLCYKFSQKYLAEYLKELIKPIIYSIIGIFVFFILMTLSFLNPLIVLLALISIPILCWSCWKGYVITYALIPCADNFIKNTAIPLKNYINEVKKVEGQLAKFVCFVAAITLILYIPTFVYTIYSPKFNIFMDIFDLISLFDNKCFLISNIIMASFLNYYLCAFYYKKEKENYFQLFLNCYKKLDVIGITIALLFTLISVKGGILYLILALFLNPIIYSINTFWYSTKN